MQVGKKFLPKEISIITSVRERLISCFWICSKAHVTVQTKDSGKFQGGRGGGERNTKAHRDLWLRALNTTEADGSFFRIPHLNWFSLQKVFLLGNLYDLNCILLEHKMCLTFFIVILPVHYCAKATCSCEFVPSMSNSTKEYDRLFPKTPRLDK